MAPNSSNAAPDLPAGLPGASPEPPRSTSDMFERVALGLEGVVVLVLDLPAGAAGSRQCRHVALGDGPVGDPGIEVKPLPVRVGHGQFTPVDFQGVLTFGQGDLVGPAISVSVPLTAGLEAELDRAQ